MGTIHLDTITTQYRRFVDDQVLTASQLNKIVDYFEDQNRLTRICLSGIGILCGLTVNFRPNSLIKVSAGCGLTTDGDLLPYYGGEYTHFKVFKDSKANYSRFEKLELFELVKKEDAKKLKASKLTTMNSLSSKVVILYLENYLEEESDCSKINCDDQGRKQFAVPKILITSKVNAEFLTKAKDDPIFSLHNNTDSYVNLPEINLSRVVLRNQYVYRADGKKVISQNANTNNYLALQESYRQAISGSKIATLLKKVIEDLFSKFALLLHTASLNVEAKEILELIDKLLIIKKKESFTDFQYRYDLVKDLLSTYQEIKQLLFDLRMVCCPIENSFPKHLLLGELSKSKEYYKLRHSFYPSPIVSNGKEKWEETRNLLMRFYRLLAEYDIPLPRRATVKVTPSKFYNEKLSVRTIPYYFKTSQQLLHFWDYSKTRKYAWNWNLAYRTSNLAQQNALLEPLKYDFEGNDFFRIEGHLGKSYKKVLAELKQKKKEHALPIEIKAVSIGLNQDSVNWKDFKCHFEDLNVLLKAWKSEQECILAEVVSYFSAFSTKDVGANVRETDYKVEVLAMNPESISEISSFRAPSLHTSRAIVADNLTMKEDTLGVVMDAAIKENENGSVHDIIASATKIVQPLVNTDAWNADASKKSLLIDSSIKLMAYTHVLNRKMPEDVTGLNERAVEEYQLDIKQLCALVKTMKSAFHQADLNASLRAFFSLLINQLSSVCCSGKKLEILYKEIDQRKQTILLQTQLWKMVENYESLEHFAGARAGWTFVLVYLIDRESKQSNGTVVADFSFPYICCSSCPSINYIIPEQPVLLNLDRDVYCLGDEEESINYEMSPTDGIIGPDIPGLKFENDLLTITEDLFPPEKLNQRINFTVNGKPTEAELRVLLSPRYDFIVPDLPSYGDEITFTPVGRPKDATFSWDFGDGTTSTERNPTKVYDEALSSDNLVTVTLTVASGACTYSVAHVIKFKDVDVPPCIEETFTTIQVDFETVNKVGTMFDDGSTIHSVVFQPTESFYNEVIDNYQIVLAGKQNDILSTFGATINRTTDHMIKARQSGSNSFEPLSMIFKWQLILIHNVLKCQTLEQLEADSDIYKAIARNLISNLTKLRDNDIDFDRNGQLKDYLSTLMNSIKDNSMLEELISKELELIL